MSGGYAYILDCDEPLCQHRSRGNYVLPIMMTLKRIKELVEQHVLHTQLSSKAVTSLENWNNLKQIYKSCACSL